MPPKKDGRTSPVVNRTACTYSHFHVIECSLQSNTLCSLGTLTTYFRIYLSIELLLCVLVAMVGMLEGAIIGARPQAAIRLIQPSLAWT
jgi:hypothetical protein